jgi:RNA-dependent RNA polymerase
LVRRNIFSKITLNRLDDFREEFDREQGALVEDEGRGLGLMGDYEAVSDWYGGKIQQVARLDKISDKFVIRLEPPEQKRSYQLARALGSRRLLQVRVPDELIKREVENIRNYLSTAKFILCGRVYLPFHAKEKSVYMVETNEDYERNSTESGDHLRNSFAQFVEWFNPMPLNAKQVCEILVSETWSASTMLIL